NPMYTAPADVNFAGAIEKVALRVHCSSHEDETAALCHWHIPEAHSLEAWSDARAYDGTVSVVQPLIAPLYGAKSFHEVVAALLGQASSGYDIVRKYWESQHTGTDFEHFWRKSLHDGVIEGTALSPKDVALTKIDWSSLEPNSKSGGTSQEATEIIFRP